MKLNYTVSNWLYSYVHAHTHTYKYVCVCMNDIMTGQLWVRKDTKESSH